MLSSVYYYPLSLSLSSCLSLQLYSRKKVVINKAAMSYRQEKSRKLSSIDCSMTEQSTLQQDERMAHSFMDAHGCNSRSKTARNIWVLLRSRELKLLPSCPSAMFISERVPNLFCQTIRCSTEKFLQVSCLFEYSAVPVTVPSHPCRNRPRTFQPS